MKTNKFPVKITEKITEKGVSAVIRKAEKIKGGKTLNYFIVECILLGKRKQVWRSDLDEAKAVAVEACIKIANGDQSSLELRSGDRLAYTRAIEILAPVRVEIDTACREYTDALQILSGKASIVEACREWVKRNAAALPKAAVADVVEQLKTQLRADRKSKDRQRQIAGVMDRFATDLNVEVHSITSDIISRWLSGLPLSERSRRNFRDVVGFFCRYCVRRG